MTNPIVRLLRRSRQIYLVASLVAIIYLYPMVSEHDLAYLVLGILFAITPLAGIYAVADNKKVMVASTALGVPALIAILAHFFFDTPILSDQVFLGLIAVYYGFTTIAIIRHLFRKRVVDLDTILSAVSAYLMIGMSFAVFHMFLLRQTPGSLVEGTSDGIVGWADIIYFSFVTLTTLGYGDITPATPHARSMAVLESTCGVLYMSILIARLVSEYRISRDKDDDQ